MPLNLNQRPTHKSDPMAVEKIKNLPKVASTGEVPGQKLRGHNSPFELHNLSRYSGRGFSGIKPPKH